MFDIRYMTPQKVVSNELGRHRRNIEKDGQNISSDLR